jgi:hypothetical protein
MRKLFAALALVILAACGASGTNPATASISGVYPLKTVNGSPLPYTIPGSTASNGVVVTSDVITMTDANTWSEVFAYTETTNGVSTNRTSTDGGPFTRSGTNIVLNSGGSPAYVGTFNGSSLILSAGGFALVYTR